MLRLFKGLGLTFKVFFKKKETLMYPEEGPNLPERYRGIQRFYADKCIVCNMCVKACPTEVISLTAEKDPETNKRKIVTYDIDFERCILCEFCTEVCPTQAVVMTTKFDNLSVYDRRALHKDRQWLENNRTYGNYQADDTIGYTKPSKRGGKK